MAKTNAIGWFDIYVNDMQRAVSFYESVLKQKLEKIGDPLTHIIRNAADHGIESPTERAALGKNRFAKVVLSAENREDRIVISVSDDGKGMDRDVILQKGIQKGLWNGPEKSSRSSGHGNFKTGVQRIF